MDKKFRVPPIILASGSPRRKFILESLQLPFEIILPKADEREMNGSVSEDDTKNMLYENAKRKALSAGKTVTAAHALHVGQLRSGNTSSPIIVGADTVVYLKNNVLGKPKDSQDAVRLLTMLSNESHQVFTALYLYSSAFGEQSSISKSEVEFRELSSYEIGEYIKTKEPYDKAGAYAVQGLGALFIKNIHGSYTNVMGFPIESFIQDLENLTQIPRYQWFL